MKAVVVRGMVQINGKGKTPPSSTPFLHGQHNASRIVSDLHVDASVMGILSPSNHFVTPPLGNDSSTTILHCSTPPTETIPPVENANAPPLLKRLPFNTLKFLACDVSAAPDNDWEEDVDDVSSKTEEVVGFRARRRLPVRCCNS